MKSRAILFWLATLFVFCGGSILWLAWHEIKGNAGEPVGSAQVVDHDRGDTPAPPPLESFTLTDQTGKPFSSRELHGKVWVLSFFYSSCPGVCRMQNTMVANLRRDFGEAGVQFVSITCDPETDTPAVLAQYADVFGADSRQWHFLTGDFDYIQRIGPMVQTVVKRETHSDRLFVMDRSGQVRGGFRSTDPEQMLALKDLLEQLLREGSDET